MSPVISVEHLSKSYRLGQIGTGTFAHDLNVWWAKVRGKPNPLLRIGEAPSPLRPSPIGGGGRGEVDTIWALRDVSFTVEQGEVLGIIGRNGAGKSTLLKILSRVTAPTSGKVKVKGRVASLLEVGTGFHPELTGRENIYLNGAILGMNRREIDRKFDEIVDFAEVEKFIDTPVKRYSSGMYVRLAFAVAAHLDPEILVVDEVLAVGDAEFQKKCLGKMGDVAQQGRTVLFVSHNMAAVRQLCQSAILLNSGQISNSGQTSKVVSSYFSSTASHGLIFNFNDGIRDYSQSKAYLAQVCFLNQQYVPLEIFLSNEILLVRLQFCVMRTVSEFDISMAILHSDGAPVFSETYSDKKNILNLHPGNYEVDFWFKLEYLKLEHYSLTLCLTEGGQTLDLVKNIVLPDIQSPNADTFKESHRWGIVRIPVEWSGARNL